MTHRLARTGRLGHLSSDGGHDRPAVAYLILRDRAEAEDVVIETLLTAFERGGEIRARPAAGRRMRVLTARPG
ncbi:MAG: hypothetical protein HY262_08780 [Chloroflexi bacterium]|nr:hypothetical protein [Chloroflexota bacterium]